MAQVVPPPFRSPWRHRALWLTIPLLVGIGAFALVGRSGQPAATTVAPPATVTTVAAARRDMPRWVAGVGTVTPLNEVMVKARVDGQLDRVAFQEGQMVNAGDLLAEIDARPYQAALVQAEAAAKRDDAQRRNAELDLSRYQKLSTLQVVPRQQLDA